MMAWAARLDHGLARAALVTVLFPFFAGLGQALMSGRAFRFEFWNFQWCVYWAAVEGAFVEER